MERVGRAMSWSFVARVAASSGLRRVPAWFALVNTQVRPSMGSFESASSHSPWAFVTA